MPNIFSWRISEWWILIGWIVMAHWLVTCHRRSCRRVKVNCFFSRPSLLVWMLSNIILFRTKQWDWSLNWFNHDNIPFNDENTTLYIKTCWNYSQSCWNGRLDSWSLHKSLRALKMNLILYIYYLAFSVLLHLKSIMKSFLRTDFSVRSTMNFVHSYLSNSLECFRTLKKVSSFLWYPILKRLSD